MVSARVKERPTQIKEAKPIKFRQDQKKDELALAAQLESVEDRGERSRLWKESTGKSEQTLYRRLQQLKADVLSDSQVDN